MRADKLNKLKMPKKSAPESEAELDLNVELGEEELPEGEEEELLGEEDMLEEGEGDMLADIDDDMLIKEMKLRGLTLDEEEGEDLGEDEEADMDMLDI